MRGTCGRSPRARVLVLLIVAQGVGRAGAAAPGAFEALVKRAAAAQKAGRLEEALGQYHKALALKPSWIDGEWALATLLYDLDRYEEARPHFRRVAAARPQDGLALALKGLCEAQLGDHQAALADLENAYRVGIPNAEVRSTAAFQSALLYNRAGNPDAAFEILRGFAVQGRDDPPILEAFGLSALRLRTLPSEVRPESREMILLAGRGAYHMARVRRTAVGRLAFEELVSRYPSAPNVHYAFGMYLLPEEPEAAIDEFRKEVRRAPDHHPALLQIAHAELKRGSPQEALRLARQAVEIAPDVPAGRLVLGRALLESGQAEQAALELERAAALAPESPDVRFSLARAYQRAGREADAAHAREEFLRLDRAARERRGGREAVGGAALPEDGLPQG